MKILIISAEVAPFAKVGGLADVAGALPRTLKAMGHDVRVAMPCYKMIEDASTYPISDVLSPFPVPIRPDLSELAYVKETCLSASNAENDESIPVYLIGSPPLTDDSTTSESSFASGYFQQATESKKVYTYAPEPYVFFCRAVLEMLTRLEPVWAPDVLHCNDWHTGLIPVFARTFYNDVPVIRDAATVFTIHNLAYQGDFHRDVWHSTGLPLSLYDVDGLEFYGRWSFMKGALIFADQVNTVSENYAREIQTPEFGCGLDGLMRTLAAQNRLSGIVNGIDYEEYDPASDSRIPVQYDLDNVKGKATCKAFLQQECNLPPTRSGALIGLISRLADQKGLDLISSIMDEMMELPVQFVLLGAGDPHYERFFREMEEKYDEQVRTFVAFDTDLAQRIYAGCDLFLMPSRFEPCGLGQMFALRYGTIPIVRATGGLADTVLDFNPETSPGGNGFVFSEYSPEALLNTIRRAVGVHQQTETWGMLVRRALASDFSWERSAEEYQELYTTAQFVRRAQTVAKRVA